jgi:hypothetical protein
MKRQAIMVLTTFSLLVMLTATSVSGQSDMRLRVNIPFEFSVGKAILPAGEYTVSYGARGLLVIQSVDRSLSQAFITFSTEASTTRDESSLVFHQYGHQYFLSTIWTAGDYIGHELSKPHAERELIRSRLGLAKSASERQTVSIVPHR